MSGIIIHSVHWTYLFIDLFLLFYKQSELAQRKKKARSDQN